MDQLFRAVFAPLREPSFVSLALVAGQSILIATFDTVVFDAIHRALHICGRSRCRLLQALYRPHAVHHAFFDQRLRFHDELIASNLVQHHGGELCTQLAVSALFLFAAEPMAVLSVWLLHVGMFLNVVRQQGKDINHVETETLRAPASDWFVGPRYHALHHIYPDSYHGSFITLFDRLMGTACHIEGRRFVVTGARGAYGRALVDALLSAGGVVETLQHGRDFRAEGTSQTADEVMRRGDVLVLCHGVKRGPTMDANCHSFVSLTERFLSLTGDRRIPVEVWAVGSEAELHPGLSEEMKAYRASKRAFARHARRWIHDERFVYRHIVPAGFRSPMGFGLMSARTAAVVSLFLIRRGFRYVPVTYTGIALVNWLLFVPRPSASGERAS